MKKTTRKEILTKQYNNALQSLVSKEVQLEHLKRLEPNHKVGDRQTQGIGSTKGITTYTAKEAVEDTEKDVEQKRLRLKVIEEKLNEI